MAGQRNSRAFFGSWQSTLRRGISIMTVLFTNPLFLKHDTGRHPETAERLRSITARLDKARLIQKCPAGNYQPINEEAVAQVHSAKQIQAAKQVAEHGGGLLDADTMVCPDSFTVALAAAGACVAAVDAVIKGTDKNALC